MKLVLPLGEDWSCERPGAFSTYTLAGAPGLRMMVSPLLPWPEDPLGWARQQLAGAAVVSPPVEIHTSDGWPALVSEGVIGDAESRLVVQYRFLDHGAAVIVRCPDPARYAQLRQGILDLLGRGRPDWSEQGILSLAQLFEGVVKPEPESASGDH